MNYSYVMGIKDIKKLKENGFNIKKQNENYMVTFSEDKVDVFEKFIIDNLKCGFWNEYLGKEIVFIFKFEDGKIKRFVLDENNEKEILKVCCLFAKYEFSSVIDMLKDNEFYRINYFNN